MLMKSMPNYKHSKLYPNQPICANDVGRIGKLSRKFDSQIDH